MRLEDYQLLLKLNEVGTIRQAAKQVMISQPAVTQRLKYMEEYFEKQIFIRTPKQLVLTPSGEMILSHAKQAVEREQRLKNQLAKTSEEVQGTLSIACSSLISQRFLPSILAEYAALYPKVTIDLVTGISETIRKDFTNYHVCIIRGEKLKESTSIHLFDDPLYIFDTEPFPKHELKERALISFKSDDSMYEMVDNWLYHHQREIKPLKMMSVDQIETCKQFMKQGLGMAVLPQSVSESLKKDYPHIPLILEGKTLTRATWVSYSAGARDLPQVDHFINVLLQQNYL